MRSSSWVSAARIPDEGLAVRAAEALGLLPVRGPERLDLALEGPLHPRQRRVDPPPELGRHRDAQHVEPFLEFAGRCAGVGRLPRDRTFGRELARALLRLLAPAIPDGRVSRIGAHPGSMLVADRCSSPVGLRHHDDRLGFQAGGAVTGADGGADRVLGRRRGPSIPYQVRSAWPRPARRPRDGPPGSRSPPRCDDVADARTVGQPVPRFNDPAVRWAGEDPRPASERSP